MMRRLAINAVSFVTVLVLTIFGSAVAFSQDLQVGYVIVTHQVGTKDGLDVFETFGETRSSGTTQAGVLASAMTTKAMLFASVSSSLSRDLGVAIANPGSNFVTVTMTLRRQDGSLVSTKTLQINPRRQTAQFVSQLFSDRSEIREFMGSLTLESTIPVAIVGLRFRGSNFSTLAITNLAPPAIVPEREPGVGGAGAFILPHFALGAGWASEIVMVNSGSIDTHAIRVDFFNQDGTPLVVNLNGQSASSFTVSTSPGGVATLSVRDSSGNSVF